MYEELLSPQYIAFLVGFLIFVLTVLLAAKDKIGLLTTTILLIIALIASVLIVNQDMVRGYFQKYIPSHESGNTKT